MIPRPFRSGLVEPAGSFCAPTAAPEGVVAAAVADGVSSGVAAGTVVVDVWGVAAGGVAFAGVAGLDLGGSGLVAGGGVIPRAAGVDKSVLIGTSGDPARFWFGLRDWSRGSPCPLPFSPAPRPGRCRPSRSRDASFHCGSTGVWSGSLAGVADCAGIPLGTKGELPARGGVVTGAPLNAGATVALGTGEADGAVDADGRARGVKLGRGLAVPVATGVAVADTVGVAVVEVVGVRVALGFGTGVPIGDADARIAGVAVSRGESAGRGDAVAETAGVEAGMLATVGDAVAAGAAVARTIFGLS